MTSPRGDVMLLLIDHIVIAFQFGALGVCARSVARLSLLVQVSF